MKDINYYLALKYPIELLETEEGFVSSHPDLPGCASFGDTAAEAIESLNEVRELWLKGQVEVKGTAPEPRLSEDFSGRFVIRLPKWVHRVLDKEAQRQGCSLNTLVVSMLSVSVGMGMQPRANASVPTLREGLLVVHDVWETDYPDTGTWSFDDVLLPPEKRRADYLRLWRSFAKRHQVRAIESVIKKRGTEEEYGEFADVSQIKTKEAN
jgi:predicted RNase H-like HicB family nuclease